MRAKTIAFAKKKRSESRQRKVNLQNEIDKLDRKICADQCLDDIVLNKYERAKKELR